MQRKNNIKSTNNSKSRTIDSNKSMIAKPGSTKKSGSNAPPPPLPPAIPTNAPPDLPDLPDLPDDIPDLPMDFPNENTDDTSSQQSDISESELPPPLPVTRGFDASALEIQTKPTGKPQNLNGEAQYVFLDIPSTAESDEEIPSPPPPPPPPEDFDEEPSPIARTMQQAKPSQQRVSPSRNPPQEPIESISPTSPPTLRQTVANDNRRVASHDMVPYNDGTDEYSDIDSVEELRMILRDRDSQLRLTKLHMVIHGMFYKWKIYRLMRQQERIEAEFDEERQYLTGKLHGLAKLIKQRGGESASAEIFR